MLLSQLARAFFFLQHETARIGKIKRPPVRLESLCPFALEKPGFPNKAVMPSKLQKPMVNNIEVIIKVFSNESEKKLWKMSKTNDTLKGMWNT